MNRNNKAGFNLIELQGDWHTKY